MRAKRNAFISSINLIIESIGELKAEKTSVKLLETEIGYAQRELKGFVECNKAFISALMQEEPEIDQSEKYKDDQQIFKKNLKTLKIALSTKVKELVLAGFIDTDIKPPPPMDGQLAELIIFEN